MRLKSKINKNILSIIELRNPDIDYGMQSKQKQYEGENGMNTARKMNNNPESYNPSERPEIISAAEKKSGKKYETYKNIEYRMDRIELSESLKFAGLPLSIYPNFANIGKFHKEYKSKMLDSYAPYTEVGYSGTYGGAKWDYIFGCQVRSLDDLPNGLICFDTGVMRFASITFRANSTYELVGDDKGPGDAMVTAGEYIKEVWLPEHMDEVNIADLKNMCFEIKNGDKSYYTNMIEIYKVELKDDPEMSFYIPLK